MILKIIHLNQFLSLLLCRAGIVSGSGPSAFSRGGPARGSKRKRGEKDPNMLLPGPVVKHHHSVKKFQVGTCRHFSNSELLTFTIGTRFFASIVGNN